MTKEEIRGLDIVVSNAKDVNSLRSEGYVCISADGDKYSGAICLSGVGGYRFRYDILAQDYQSATLGFQTLLLKKTESIYKLFKSKLLDAQKIAFIGKGEEYCFRFLLVGFFLDNIVSKMPGTHVNSVTYRSHSLDSFSSIAYTNQYYHQAMRISDHFDLPEVIDKLSKCTWIFAKTMPQNPHEYTLRKNWGGDNPRGDFLRVATYLRMFGEFEEFGGVMWRIKKIGDYKYWCCAFDYTNERVDLINRAKI